MSHIVSSSAPISGAHTVKQYAGFGILGSAIPTTGDSGGSPVANDGVNANAEYHWRVETPPSAGALTIYPDLSFGFDATGLSNAAYTWVYRLYEDGVSVGTAMVTLVVGTIAQLARPSADISSGNWVSSLGGPLYAAIDEVTADDADYIGTTYGSVCEVALGSLADPGVSSGHKVRYRIAADAGGIVVRLRQGATTIASWTHNPAPTSLSTFEQTLSGAEADSITDYSALKLQFEAY